MRRHTKIIMENGALPETKKLLISGYLGERSTEQFVYFSVEMTDEAALELRDGITALFGLI